VANIQKLKQMAEAVRQREREQQEAEDRRAAETFRAWTQTAFTQELRDALQFTPGWDQRQQTPMATFALGTERGRLYRSGDNSGELGTVIFTDPDGRETLSATFHSEDELLLLIEKYL
jgi:hypothetical protein